MPIGNLAASQRVRLLRQRAFHRDLAANTAAAQADRDATVASMQRYARLVRAEASRVCAADAGALASDVVRLLDAHGRSWPSVVPPRALLLALPALTPLDGNELAHGSEALRRALARHLALVDSGA